MRFLHLGVVMAMLGAGLACSDVDSDELETNQIFAEFLVQSDGVATAQVSVILRKDSAQSLTFVELEEGDDLSATVGDDTQSLDKESFQDAHRYVAEFVDLSAGELVTVTFERSRGDVVEAELALPLDFSLDAPLADAEFSRPADDIVLQWSDGAAPEAPEVPLEGATMRVEAAAACFEVWSSGIPADTRTYTIPAGSFVANDDSADTCGVDLEIRRDLEGTVGEGLQGDSVARGRQIRAVAITSTP